jgi:lipopolysaccharide transport system ATP-binding protein
MSSDLFGASDPKTSRPAIRIDNVSKRYVMFDRPEDRFKQMIVSRLQRLAGRPPTHYFRDFAALNDVSLEVARGETVGIIGRNGSGKSTLLQIICGTLQPTSGVMEVNGRIAALLELGAGFNPEFTGRENVFLNAQILGVPRQEIEWRFDDIARFADIGPFIDQPVKTYSSGMYVRLAFAVAINVDPDILVVDEALSVGDEAFQRKCFARIEDIKDKGGTILFVSHGAQTIVQLCTRAVLIDAGEKLLEGAPKRVVAQYQRLVNLTGEQATVVRAEIARMGQGGPVTDNTKLPAEQEEVQGGAAGIAAPPLISNLEEEDAWLDPKLTSHSRVEYESRGATISNVRITTRDGKEVNVLRSDGRYYYEYVVQFDRDVRNVGFGMLIKTTQGFDLGGGATDFSPTKVLKKAVAGSRYRVRFDLRWTLNPGVYFLNAGVTGSADGAAAYTHRLLDAMAFRIMPESEQLATGWINFDPLPIVELIATQPSKSG